MNRVFKQEVLDEIKNDADILKKVAALTFRNLSTAIRFANQDDKKTNSEAVMKEVAEHKGCSVEEITEEKVLAAV